MRNFCTVICVCACLSVTAVAKDVRAIPDFKDVKVCVALDGKLAIDAKATLASMGVNPANFVDRNGNCLGVPTPYVRIGVSHPRKMQASSRGSSAYGSVGSFSSGGSSSNYGDWIAVEASATLVRGENDLERIGFCSEAFQAGGHNSSGSTSGSTNKGSYSNSGSSYGTVSEEEAAGDATRHSLRCLLHSKKSWTPGADQVVDGAFGKSVPTHVADAATAPQTTAPTKADRIRAKAEALKARTQEIKESIRAKTDDSDDISAAKKELADAEKELAAAKDGAKKKK
jgi:hypothetical protein